MLYLNAMQGPGKMTDCHGDGEGDKSPLEIYEQLAAQGDEVRVLKNAKAEEVGARNLTTNSDFTLG